MVSEVLQGASEAFQGVPRVTSIPGNHRPFQEVVSEALQGVSEAFQLLLEGFRGSHVLFKGSHGVHG